MLIETRTFVGKIRKIRLTESTDLYVMFRLLFLAVIVPVASAKLEPPSFNAALRQPLTQGAGDSTCGVSSSQTFCRSASSVQSVESCEQDTCDSSCPISTNTARFDLFTVILSAQTTDCVAENSTDAAPGEGVVKNFLINKTQDCYLDLNRNALFSLKLQAKWSVTFFFWLYMDTTSSEDRVILDFTDSALDTVIRMLVLDGQFYVQFGQNERVTRDTWTLPLNRWTHVAIQVYDRSVSVFFDGKFVTPAVYGINVVAQNILLNYRVGNTLAEDAPFVGYLQEMMIYPKGLANRDIERIYSGIFPETRYQSDCRCSPGHPALKPTNNRYCVQNEGVGMATSEVNRLNSNAYPLENINDGIPDTPWISQLGVDRDQQSQVTISLAETFEVRKVTVNLYSPYPGVLILQRRANASDIWTNWQFYSQDCLSETGFFPNQPLTSADDIKCSFFYNQSNANTIQYSNSRVVFDLLAGRPGNVAGVFSDSLRSFLFTDAVRVILRGHPLVLDRQGNERHWYHGINEISVDAKCDCHGHASSCDVTVVPYQCQCDVSTLTTGRQCDQCVDGAYKIEGVDDYAENLCNLCACSVEGTIPNAVNTCEQIGGQCACKTYASGRACDTCLDGYFNLQLNNSDGCEACQCFTNGTVDFSNTCDPVTSQCPCKPNVDGLDCSSCAEGFYSVDFSAPGGCVACACNSAGTLPGQTVCNTTTGQCACKTNVTGRACDTCKPGSYNLDSGNSAGCQSCECNVDGSTGPNCDVTTGQCPCKPGVTGRQCDTCQDGFYAANNTDFAAVGCSYSCNCSMNGTFGGVNTCEQYGGQCPCKTNVEGRQCDRCVAGSYGLGDVTLNLSPDIGCANCDCFVAGTVNAAATCDVISGQCDCKSQVISRRCDTCKPGSFGLSSGNAAGCDLCGCSILGTETGEVCDDLTGQCPCISGAGVLSRGGKQCLPYADVAEPAYGPLSGGTLLSIPVGYVGPISNVSILIGDEECQLQLTESSPQVTACLSQSFNGSLPSGPLPVNVILSDSTRLSAGQFSYKRDPVINDVYPLQSFLGGGIPLTVSGSNLDSVARPVLVVVLTVPDTSESFTFTSVCKVLNFTSMMCPTPNITLPSETTERLLGEGDDFLETSIGFRLDGVTAYSNLTETLPQYSVLKFYLNPEFEMFDGDNNVQMYRTYWPYDHKFISIEGKRLTLGATEEDYRISIGDELCEGVSLSDNQIDCNPPAMQPAAPDGTGRNGAPEVRVDVGNIRFLVGFLRYETSFWQNTTFRAGVIGGLVAAVLLIALIIFLCWCVRRRRNRSRASNSHLDKSKMLSTSLETWPMSDSHFEEGTLEKRFDGKATQSSNITYLRPEIERDMPDLLGQLPRELRTTVMKCQIDKELITLGKLIGEGHFGRVYLGQMVGSSEAEQIPVAVKTLRDYNINLKEIVLFLEEATLMRGLHHDHVLGLLGVAIHENNAYVILPYMENGDLKGFISNDDNMLTVGELIHFSMQIADGMHYLSEQRFVHRDLACRNCMINKDFEVKVADFGLSRDIYESDYYKVSNNKSPLPVKWMAIESLERGVFDTKTDVWSFGVVLWELLTRGCQPYPDIDNFEVKTFITCGNRMDRPDYAPDEMYSLMLECWHDDSTRRPSFRKIYNRIASFLDDSSSKTIMRDRQSQHVPSIAYRGRSYLALDPM